MLNVGKTTCVLSLYLNQILKPELFQYFFFGPECDQRTWFEAYGSTQGYNPARSTNSPCSHLL